MICESFFSIILSVIFITILLIIAFWANPKSDVRAIYKTIGLRNYIKAMFFNKIDDGNINRSDAALFSKYRARSVIFTLVMMISIVILAWQYTYCTENIISRIDEGAKLVKEAENKRILEIEKIKKLKKKGKGDATL